MLQLDLSADVARVGKELSLLARERIPSAVARALTKTAFDARDAVRQSLPERFTIRRPWVAQGIGVTPATAQTLAAHVWSRDRFMALQETGGTKTGKQAIPVGPMAALAKRQVIPKRLWPGQLDRKRTFIRAGTLFERRGDTIQALYLLRRQQAVAPRFGMAETVAAVVPPALARQMVRAMREGVSQR